MAASPRRRKRLLAMGLGTLFAFAAAEAALRAFGGPRDELLFLPKDGSVAWDCYCSNPRGYFVQRDFRGRAIWCVDDAGAPPREVNLAAPEHAGKTKILAIGDSFTYGLGAKIVDGWPHRLEQLLAARTGKPVVVSNAGKVGRHVMEILTGQFEPTLDQGQEPDIVVYGWCLNDPIWAPQGTDDRTNPLAPRKPAAGMDNGDIDDFINVRTQNLEQLRVESRFAALRRSRVVDLALRVWESREIRRRTIQFHLDLYDPKKNAAGLAVTFNALRKMHDRRAVAGKRFVVALFPMFVDLEGDYPLRPIHDFMQARLGELGIECLDTLPAFKGRTSAELWVHPVDRHPNELAHRLIAEFLAERLSKPRP